MELVVCNSKSDERRGAAACKFTDDIIEEILCRLDDAQSVMRCKCVCKSWLSLITHPSFKHRHLKHQVPGIVLHNLSVSIPFLIHRRGSESFSSHKCPEDIDHISVIGNSRKVAIMGSQNGVICLYYTVHKSVYLWNPSIRKLRILPPPPPPPPPPRADSPTYMYGGLGYDALTDDFKVVSLNGCLRRIRDDYFKRGKLVEVYSLRSDCWKTLEMPDLFSGHDYHGSSSSTQMITDSYNSCCSLVVNGSIHWLIHYGRRERVTLPLYAELYLDHVGIVAFDMSTEVFSLIDSPAPSLEDGFKASNVHSMCDWSGHLSLLTLEGSSPIEIWVMKQYGVSDSWTKHFSVDFSNLPVPPSVQSFQYINPIALYNNGDLLVQFEYRGSFYRYDRKRNSIEYLCPAAPVVQFTTYVESIFLS
ncbi:F-box domain containing protein [Trema orientale]|uniref:F-box domain containing protein n=1 Tax=Trema orientale TaxID=63057 RepID=A0A2P5DFS6_TREOI|nr:F-box domain containing protein [Trema orientale]